MAEIAYSDLNCKTNFSIKKIEYNNFSIEVKQYLPTIEKLLLITNVLMNITSTDINYANDLKIQIYYEIEMLRKYSNIVFSEEDLNDLSALYDNLYSSGLITKIFEAIPKEEKEKVALGIKQTIENIYKYQNSVLGVLDSIKENYNTTDLDITKLQNKIQDKESLATLKQITNMLG